MKKKSILTIAMSMIIAFQINAQITVNLKVFLEGPFGTSEMYTSLNDAGSIPMLQPYQVEPWIYSVADQVSSIPNSNIVDWVLVEIIQPKLTGEDTSFILLERKSAFLLNNGNVVALDGSGLLVFADVNVPEFHARLIHRNHIPITSSAPLIKTGEVYNCDFTVSAAMAKGGAHSQNELTPGIWGMIAGDGDNNGQVDNRDKDDVWLMQQGMVGYINSDYNLDGIVNENDLSMRWDLNSGKGIESLINTEGFLCGEIMVDYRNGSSYGTIQIGDQCWMSSNLNIGTMINGGIDQTDNDILEKYCYNNDTNNCNDYGALYQWDELVQYDSIECTQGICPYGWHLPNVADWEILINYLGGITTAGGELVVSGSSGFDALMNGQYSSSGSFSGINGQSTFWTASGIPSLMATGFYIVNGNPAINSQNGQVTNAYGTRCLKGLPNRVDQNVRVIDTTVYQLVSDSIELSQGIYRYIIIGQKKAKDIIVADNIIIGTEDMGYLRKVEVVDITGNEMTLNTSEAKMNDVFIEGEFQFTSDTTETEKGHLSSYTKVVYLAEGVKIIPKNGEIYYDLSGIELFDNGTVKVTVPQGHIQFEPKYNFEFAFGFFKVKKLSFIANDVLLENSLDIQLEANGQFNGEHEKLIFEKEFHKWYITPSSPPIPVKVIITTQLKCILGIEIISEFMATTGYTNSNNLSFGLRYEKGTWQKIWDLNKSTQFHPIVWGNNNNMKLKLQLVPEISIKFYGVVGPYFNLPLWNELDANLSTPELNFDASINVGLDGILGADITIFDEKLLGYEKQLFGFEKQLYTTPCLLDYVSGNNQTGTVNQQLSNPIIVNVTDTLGEHYIPARVHFTVVSGNGTLSAPDVWTDGDGNAQTYWTLGALPGIQEIKAEVRKANGQNISGSPTFLSATATAGCGQPFTDIRDGQSYNTVQIGTQCWLAENMNIGTMINASQNQTNNSIIEKYCYNNTPSNCATYGGLYQWNEMMQYTTQQGAQGICPPGWHVSTDAEYTTLTNFLGGETVAGGKMKEVGTTHWNSPNTGATNVSGFTALPGGYLYNGSWYGLGTSAFFWASEFSFIYGWRRTLSYSSAAANRSFTDKGSGHSVRCIKN